MGLFRKKVNGYVIKHGVYRHGERWRAASSRKYKFGVLVAFLIVGLVGCGMPPSPGSLAIDRAGEVVEAVLAEPNDAQIAVYKRELIAGYKAVIPGFSWSDEDSWEDAIDWALSVCRELAKGVSVTDVRAVLIVNVESQLPIASPIEVAQIVDANLRAQRAPGSLCP
ncbi:DUF732 domain-containing protein [Actinomycetota bacterium]|nr:DUF732 domain-containing protein [Actinomycetota bacterium]